MKNRINSKIIAFFLCLIGISAAAVIVFGLVENIMNKTGNNRSAEDEFSYSAVAEGSILFENTRYLPKDSLETILILGLDKKLTDSSTNRQNSEQADYLALLIMDEEQKNYTILQLNRDTMTEISQLSVTGEKAGTIYAQLALAHVYGGNDRDRCRNTVRAVENLLYGIDIDHYLSLTMDAVPILNDSVGGVEVQLMDDFTELDASFVKDAVVTLHGEQALAYVQARSSLEDSTNIHRMERQKQYLSALLAKNNHLNLENAKDTVMQISQYMVSDYTINQLSELMNRLGSYTCNESLTLNGESVKGKEYMEYYVDEFEVQKLVIELFYTPMEET